MICRALFVMTSVPALAGIALGCLYPAAGAVGRHRIEDLLLDFADPAHFNAIGLATVLCTSCLVMIAGPVAPQLSGVQKFVLRNMPLAALATCVPFFAATTGFLAVLPAGTFDPKLWLIVAVGAISSAGFLVLLIAPAHANLFPRNEAKKRRLYAVVFISTLVAFGDYYGFW